MSLAIDKEVFENLKETIVAGVSAAGEVEILKGLPSEPDDVYYLLQRGKEPQRCVAARRRNDSIGSLGDVIEVVKGNLVEGTKTVWVSGIGVVVMYSDAGQEMRRDRATYLFAFGPEFLTLEELLKRWKEPTSKGISQREILSLIKTRLWNAFDADVDRKKLLDQLSKIVTTGTSELGQGTATILNDTKSKVADDQFEPLPETVTLRVPVLLEHDVDTAEEIVCLLDVSSKGDEFKLIPIESDLIHSRRHAPVLVAEYLKTNLPEISVLTGSP